MKIRRKEFLTWHPNKHHCSPEEKFLFMSCNATLPDLGLHIERSCKNSLLHVLHSYKFLHVYLILITAVKQKFKFKRKRVRYFCFWNINPFDSTFHITNISWSQNVGLMGGGKGLIISYVKPQSVKLTLNSRKTQCQLSASLPPSSSARHSVTKSTTLDVKSNTTWDSPCIVVIV